MSPRAVIRRESVRGLAFALLLSVALPYLADWLSVFGDRPWGAGLLGALFLLCLVVLAFLLWRDKRLVLGGGRLSFFLAYCALFTLATETEVLSGPRRELTGFEDALPRNFLALNRLGDWHYWFVGRRPSAEGFVLVLLPPMAEAERVAPPDAAAGAACSTDPVESRTLFAALIQAAVDRRAKGIAFDYYPRCPSLRDPRLCGEIDAARGASMPVLFGYAHEERGGVLQRQRLPDSLAGCIRDSDLGSLAGYLEFDGQVRLLPSHFRNDPDLPSLSFRIAAAGAATPLRPPPLVQYVAPAQRPHEVKGRPTAPDLRAFQDRFVVVGSQRAGELRMTPFGQIPGSEIHLYAAACLAQDRCIGRPGAHWTFPSIYLMCFLLAVAQARGGGGRALAVLAAALSALVVALAAAAMWVWNLWIDVSYPLLALWVLAALLAAGGALAAARRRPAEGSDAGEQPVFDVFLSHSWADKGLVRELADLLEARGLRVWLDERELRPGQPWQDALEENIDAVRSVAVLIGREDVDRWHKAEMRLALKRSVERNLPVIPVLLPGAPQRPSLPGFLELHTWVDFSDGFARKPLDRLEWGITGIKPGRRASLRAVA